MNEKSLKLLEQYDLELIGARRGRGSYICETSLGMKILTDYTGSEKKIAFTNQLLEWMEEQGYTRADKAVRNKEGVYLCKDRDDQTCILKDWYEGRECDARNQADVKMAAANLGRLHRMMVWKPKERAQEYCAENMLLIWKKHNQELKKIHAFICRRRQKNAYERLFLECYPVFATQAEAAVQKLEQSGYDRLFHDSLEMGQLCHGSYHQHNIYFTGHRQVFTSNFEKCAYDIQVKDLYQFLRKIMEKQEWDTDTADTVLEAYNREKTLTEAEQEYLSIRLLYPEKFWKVANQYYNCRKSCVSGKNAQKLEKLICQEEKRARFLACRK